MRSMTGYGRASAERDGRQLTVEAKSVNNRFLDIAFRTPRNLLFLEEEMRKRICEAVSRGHLDVYVSYVNLREDARQVAVDQGLLDGYLRALSQIEARSLLPLGATASSLAALHDVLVVTEAQEDREALSALTQEALAGALAELTRMREREGEALSRDVLARVGALEALCGEIERRYPDTVRAYRERLQKRLTEMLAGNALDEQRLAQEVALMADRSAVDEEVVRLYSHFAQLRAIAAEDAPVGRRLDFIVQELNREFNTISSKSQDVEMTRLIVSAKAEVEKIREQVQNIE